MPWWGIVILCVAGAWIVFAFTFLIVWSRLFGFIKKHG